MKISDVRSIVAYWQTALNLIQWEFKVKFVATLPIEDAIAMVVWSAEDEAATISVLRGVPDAIIEETIVHELLHPLLEGHLNISKDYDVGYERGLNKIAKALVAHKYE